MERDHDDNEMQEMIEEFAEDLGRSHKRDEEFQSTENSSVSVFQERPIIWGGMGIIFLISLLALFSGDGKDELKEEFLLLSDRLEQIEQKISIMEGTLKESGENQSRFNSMQKTLSNLDNRGKSLNNQINDLIKRIDKMESALTTAQSEIKKQSSVNVEPKTTVNVITHLVRKGDTLYRISQKYNVPINELQSLNNLKKDQDIFPGQRLVISK